MTIEKIRKVKHAKPFRPFMVHFRDGRQVFVQQPHYLALSPGGTFIVVCGMDNSHHRIELEFIADLTFQKKTRGLGGR